MRPFRCIAAAVVSSLAEGAVEIALSLDKFRNRAQVLTFAVFAALFAQLNFRMLLRPKKQMHPFRVAHGLDSNCVPPREFLMCAISRPWGSACFFPRRTYW